MIPLDDLVSGADPLEPYGPNTALVMRFRDRLGELTFQDLCTVVRRWREMVAPAWLAAEEASGTAVWATGRGVLLNAALKMLFDVFDRWRWSLPDVHATSAYVTAQYLAATALAALLQRDHLSADQVEELYAPFATLIPLVELEKSVTARYARRE